MKRHHGLVIPAGHFRLVSVQRMHLHESRCRETQPPRMTSAASYDILLDGEMCWLGDRCNIFRSANNQCSSLIHHSSCSSTDWQPMRPSFAGPLAQEIPWSVGRSLGC